MHRSTRALLASVTASGLGVAVATTFALPAQAMPERYADAGTIVWCEGEGGYLEAGATSQAPAYWSAGVFTEGGESVALGEGELLVGDRLEGTFPAHDQESGDEVGDLTIEGTIVRGETEIVSGWDIDPDGRRYRSEGTRTPLTGSVTLSLGDIETTLTCSGWEIDLETFVLNRERVAERSQHWLLETYPLGGGAGSVTFYGERKTALGISLDLLGGKAFAEESLQVHHGTVSGTLLLRDSDTFAVIGAVGVSGTLRKTGTEHAMERTRRYSWVDDLAHYDVTLTITTAAGEWTGTWEATYRTLRTRAVTPPRSLKSSHVEIARPS